MKHIYILLINIWIELHQFLLISMKCHRRYINCHLNIAIRRFRRRILENMT